MGKLIQPITRCAWAGVYHGAGEDAYIHYHDTEWGVPVHDDQRQFEFLNLEGAQAGLSWRTILNKRGGYRRVFDGFDPEKLAHWSDAQLEIALLDPGIVRNRLKVYSVRKNAQAFLKIVESFGSFDRYIWGFVEGEPVQNAWKTMADVPATSPISDKLSKDLKKRGFSFIGSTIIYAHMQATGMVNDHTVDCFRWRALGGK